MWSGFIQKLHLQLIRPTLMFLFSIQNFTQRWRSQFRCLLSFPSHTSSWLSLSFPSHHFNLTKVNLLYLANFKLQTSNSPSIQINPNKTDHGFIHFWVDDTFTIPFYRTSFSLFLFFFIFTFLHWVSLSTKDPKRQRTLRWDGPRYTPWAGTSSSSTVHLEHQPTVEQMIDLEIKWNERKEKLATFGFRFRICEAAILKLTGRLAAQKM
jgi:hypothetical protein